MGFSAIAGMIAGTTAVTATAVLGAVTTIGLEMSLVGAVTGSKGLMKLGGVMSLVGGVGGMINGAIGSAATGAAAEGLAGEFSGAAAQSLAEETAGTLAESLADDAVTTAAGGLAETGMAAAEDAVFGLDGAMDWASAADDAWQELGYSEGLVDAIPAKAEMPIADTPDAFTFKPTEAATTKADYKLPTDGVKLNAGDAAKAAGQKIEAPPKDYFSEFLTWVKNNEKTANTIMQLGGSALSGMNQRAMFDEKMALEKSRNQYGNTVANLYGKQPLIGAMQ